MTSAQSGSGTSSLFGLAPCGVCPARRITATAVRPYRTFSPLPRRSGQSSPRWYWLNLYATQDAVIPKPRVFTSGARNLARTVSKSEPLPRKPKPHQNGGAVYFLWHFPSSEFPIHEEGA